jgi:hypothetical protein
VKKADDVLAVLLAKNEMRRGALRVAVYDL